jgi:hypothetical protein
LIVKNSLPCQNLQAFLLEQRIKTNKNKILTVKIKKKIRSKGNKEQIQIQRMKQNNLQSKKKMTSNTTVISLKRIIMRVVRKRCRKNNHKKRKQFRNNKTNLTKVLKIILQRSQLKI